jgi:hypothetical protein
MKKVWILGAGFSVPLDGPTLESLFSSTSCLRVGGTCCYLDDEGRRELENVQKFYKKYATSSKDAGDEIFWSNPEDFLDKLEASLCSQDDNPNSNDSPFSQRPANLRIFAERFAAIHPPSQSSAKDDKSVVSTALHAAKRLLAGECYVFTRFADPKTEKWRAFVTWAAGLTTDDTVITFNYDRVLEIIRDYLKNETGRTPFKVLFPDDVTSYNGTETRVLKLHGSIDWVRHADGRFTLGDADAAIKSRPEQIALATPGSSKSNAITEFNKLWTAAMAAIEESSRVIFIGYRLPETDALAREKLMLSLKLSRSIQNIDIVLGPNVESGECVRMANLAKFATGRHSIVSQIPLWGQDFLALSGLGHDL